MKNGQSCNLAALDLAISFLFIVFIAHQLGIIRFLLQVKVYRLASMLDGFSRICKTELSSSHARRRISEGSTFFSFA